MAEKKVADEYKEAMDAAARELKRIHGGNREYIQWLGKHSPFWVSLIAYLNLEMERGVELMMPLSLFKAHLRTFLAANREAYEMWKERDWFDLHTRTIPPGLN
jgi:hypothetical protein